MYVCERLERPTRSGQAAEVQAQLRSFGSGGRGALGVRGSA